MCTPPQLGVCSQAGLVALASLLASNDDLNKPELHLLQVAKMIMVMMMIMMVVKTIMVRF